MAAPIPEDKDTVCYFLFFLIFSGIHKINQKVFNLFFKSYDNPAPKDPVITEFEKVQISKVRDCLVTSIVSMSNFREKFTKFVFVLVLIFRHAVYIFEYLLENIEIE